MAYPSPALATLQFRQVGGFWRSIRLRLPTFIALPWYDGIALQRLGRRIRCTFVALASFTAYAIAHNIGASVLSRAVAPQANVIAALLVLRLLYLNLPLVFSIVVAPAFERHRWRALMPLQGDRSHAISDHD